MVSREARAALGLYSGLTGNDLATLVCELYELDPVLGEEALRKFKQKQKENRQAYISAR